MAQLTRDAAQKAYDMNKAAIEHVMKMTNSTGYHIIIGNSKGEIFFELSVNTSEWTGDYKGFATGKFDATVRTGLSMGELIDNQQDLQERQDPPYRGSWKDGDTITSISGFPEYWDEAKSKAVSADASVLVRAA